MMATILVSLVVAFICGVLCFIVDIMDAIPVRLNRHRDSILAGITCATAGFFASLIFVMISGFPV